MKSKNLSWCLLSFSLGIVLGHHGPLVETHGWVRLTLTLAPFVLLLAAWAYFSLSLRKIRKSSRRMLDKGN